MEATTLTTGKTKIITIIKKREKKKILSVLSYVSEDIAFLCWSWSEIILWWDIWTRISIAIVQ